MARGERVARVYIGAVLLAQALVTGASGFASPYWLAVQIVAAGALQVPFVRAIPSVRLRAATTVPAVVVSLTWAREATPLGSAAWVGWAVLTIWLCFPAGLSATDTLAERFHPVRHEGAPPR